MYGETLTWIGLTDESNEGNWQWITGEPLVFTNWHPNQPDNESGSQHHAAINFVYQELWDDAYSDHQYAYVLEIEINDGDVTLDPGESASLVLTIENENGWTDAEDVNAILICDNSSVHITNNSASYGEIINGSSSANSSAPFIFYTDSDIELGDINFDGSLNILDIVILSNAVLSGEYLPEGDINDDGTNNVLDIVGLVNYILTGESPVQLPIWDYIDINPNSDYFDQLIGPETFNGNVSLYYFGKAG